jgi:MFS family permease
VPGAYRSTVTPQPRTPEAPASARPSVRGLKHLWEVRGLRRLAYVRVFSAFGDGAFQGALAVLVLFSPERKSNPAEIAAGFAVLLLPYSIIGPFAGALLDRWSRRRVIVWASLIRCVLVLLVALEILLDLTSAVLFITALFIMGVGRFVGSGLSASTPHTVAKDSLVGANALTTTAGAIAIAVGGGYAIVLRSLLGESSSRVAIITATVAVFYLLAALIASRFRLMELGPDETDEPAQPVLAVLEGFSSGLKHIVERRTVGYAVIVVMVVRFCFGLCTMVVLLLFQKYFTESVGPFRTGAPGIAEVLAAGAIGVFGGAVLTPLAVRRLGRTRHVVVLLSATSVIVVIAAIQFTIISTVITAFVMGLAYQSSKVCMDTVVQSDSDDAHVGRVFALYDTANNLCYVGAFALGVWLVPENGRGVGAVFLVGGLLLAVGLWYGVVMARWTRRRSSARAVDNPGSPADSASGLVG